MSLGNFGVKKFTVGGFVWKLGVGFLSFGKCA